MPQNPSYSRQYMSAVFYHTEEQQRLAVQTKQQLEAAQEGKIYTKILPFQKFYLAEDYHQKYSLQHRKDIMQELNQLFPDLAALVDSTTAARINGYLANYGTFETLQREFERLGIPPSNRQALLDQLK